MEFSKDQIELLKKPILAKNVKEREAGWGGKDNKLAFVEGYHVIAEANRIFGFGGWSSETIETTCVQNDPKAVSYIAKVRITVGDVIREGTGAGHGNQSNHGNNHESAIKEAETDARKRAFMQFGNQFGLSLYNGKDKSWKTNKENQQNQTSEIYELAFKWIQKATTQQQLDQVKERLESNLKEGKISQNDKFKLTNAIVQKEASLL